MSVEEKTNIVMGQVDMLCQLYEMQGMISMVNILQPHLDAIFKQVLTGADMDRNVLREESKNIVGHIARLVEDGVDLQIKREEMHAMRDALKLATTPAGGEA